MNSFSTIYAAIRKQGFRWAFQRSFSHLGHTLLLPSRMVQQKKAIRAARNASVQSRVSKHAVFVCDQLQVRAIKMAYALKEVGWAVTLLHRDNIFKESSDYFCETRQFTGPFEALRIAATYRPVVYHIFSNYNFEVAAVFVRYKPGLVVFDNYDVLTGMVKESILDRYRRQAELEKYCYLNADGLCCRDLRVQHLKKVLGYRLPCRLLFSEYCWPENKFPRTPKLTDGIHVVYVGSIETNPNSTAAFIYELAGILSKNGIHLHIYPSLSHIIPELKRVMRRYVDLDDAHSYVHIHETISPVAIRKEISQYHYGVLISTSNIDYGDNHDTYFARQADYLLAAKVFDYLDAGLFSFIQNLRFTRFILRSNGKVASSLDDIAWSCKAEQVPSVKVSKTLSLEGNVHRLTKFYRELSSIKQSQRA